VPTGKRVLRHFPQAAETCRMAYKSWRALEEAIEIFNIAAVRFRD
jgi:hypothetical protein